jgi:hypothetical protein
VSGSTRVERRTERVRLVLETPCISFAMNPDGSSPEQAFHARARERFEVLAEALWPGLADEVERAAADAGVALEDLQQPADWQRRVSLSAGGEGRIELVTARPLQDAQRERLQIAVASICEARTPRPPPPEASPPPERRWWPWSLIRPR